MRKLNLNLILLICIIVCSCSSDVQQADIVIQNGLLYDGTGEKPLLGTIAIKDDSIMYVGKPKQFNVKKPINASGKSIAPGFINMLSWGYNSLIKDGRGLSDLMQGVTLEVFGEGTSPGPIGKRNSDNYLSFGQAMDSLQINGISTNIASFLGATTVRKQVIGYENRRASEKEYAIMQKIVSEAMEEGAMGIGSSLIYAPGDYADTEELIHLNKVASSYGGMYISHMRNEDNKVLEALEELITIAKEAAIPAEIYHLKLQENQIGTYWIVL